MKFRSRIYKDIIVEGHKRVLLEKQDFLEMFNDILKIYGVVKDLLDESGIGDDSIYFSMLHDTVSLHLADAVRIQVEDVKKACKRGGQNEQKFAPDMATWVLRYYKIADYMRLINISNQILTFIDDDEPALAEVAQRVRALTVDTMNKYIKKLTKINPKFEEFIIRDPSDEDEAMKIDRQLEKILDWTKRKLTHYVGMVHVQGIQNARFTDQWYDELETQFAGFEAEWQRKMEEVKSVIPHDMSQGGEIIMKFPDGKYWIDLKRQHCDAEGKAMGHCGNNQHGGRATGETVLSLRQDMKMPDGRMGGKPFLTFILGADGKLGETKARFNEKPGKEWHSYILALLKMPIIKGIRGGGYAPERNFFMKELTIEDQLDLFKVRPDLFTDQEKETLMKATGQQEGQPQQPQQQARMQETRIRSRRPIR